MEMISIGPTNVGAHSPAERVKAKSVEKVWEVLLNILKKIS